jgi:integrase
MTTKVSPVAGIQEKRFRSDVYQGGIMTIRTKKSKIERKPYSESELQSIIDCLELPKITDGKPVWKKPANFWIPLLAIFTGMRRSEICQLYKSDIVEKGGVNCIYVGDGEYGQSIISEASRRYIPLHSELIRLGFLKFVEDSEPGPLFPELKPSTVGRCFHEKWRWFSRAVSRKVSLDSGKSFSSIRSTFAKKLIEANALHPLLYNLLGRQWDVETVNRYCAPIDPLNNLVNGIVYDGLQLGRLEVYSS